MPGCRPAPFLPPATRLVRLAVILAAWFAAVPVAAAPYDGQPKILLHLGTVTSKSACIAGERSDCGTAVTAGEVGGAAGPFYYAYVLAAKGNLPDLAGVQFGIRYENGCVNGRNDNQQVDVLAWTLCGSLEFTTPGFYSWPGPNSGTTITWDPGPRCQVGETAVAGYFYVACYGAADTMRVIPRPVDGLAAVAQCNSNVTNLPVASLGSAVFSPGGSVAGCNPCNGPCSPPPTSLSCGPGVDVTPPAPVTLQLQQRTDTAVTVRWAAPGDDGTTGGPATSYDLRWFSDYPYDFAIGTPVPGVPAPAAPGTLQSATTTGLSPGGTYWFVLRSADEMPNWSVLSNRLSVTTLTMPPDLTVPAAIADLAQVDATLTTLRVGWTATGDDGAVGTASSHEMRRAASPITTDAEFVAATLVTGLPAPAAAGTHQEVTLTGLAPGTTCYLAIRARDEAANESPLSNSPACTTSARNESIPPAAVTDLKALAATPGAVRLGWTAPGDDGSTGTATTYDIRYATSPITAANFASAVPATGEPVPLPAGTPQELTITTLSAGVVYYFAMKSVDDQENLSDLSNVVSRRATDNSGARILLHSRIYTTKNVCAIGQLADCGTAAVNNQPLYPPARFTYLLAGKFGDVGALQCGIQYDQGAPDGDANARGVDVWGWTLCADLESPSTAPIWPKPGSGNLISWNAATKCQVGGTAVAGYFYMGAYTSDRFQVTPRPSDGLARVYDCAGASQDLTAAALGSVGYGTRQGYNPCSASGPPSLEVRPTTWSQIKTLIRN
ncbi:MAG TPA: hypothetical protein VF720_10595 [Candidatus Eisenbacteria bacterium]